MDESQKLPRSGDRANEQASHKAKTHFVDIDKKALSHLLYITGFILLGFYQWSYRLHFEPLFDEKLKPIQEAHHKEHEYLRRDIDREATKNIEQDQHILDINRNLNRPTYEINRGGK